MTGTRTGSPAASIAVFGPKGGVGRTTLAVNLAVAAATELGQRTCLVDGSFQFGDIGVLLNLNPKNKSIADLIPELEVGEPESLDTFLIKHSAGINVLLAPPSPEMAELITPPITKRMLEALRASHDLVIVDCMSTFNDTTLAILDIADTVLTMLSLEITSIKNIRLFLEVAEQLGYGSDKVRLVLNRADSSLGHPRRGRRAFDRPAGRPHHRLRWPQRGVRTQPGRAVLPVQPRGAGVPGRPAAGPGGRRDGSPSDDDRRAGGQEGRTEEVTVRVAMTWQRRNGRQRPKGYSR